MNAFEVAVSENVSAKIKSELCIIFCLFVCDCVSSIADWMKVLVNDIFVVLQPHFTKV